MIIIFIKDLALQDIQKEIFIKNNIFMNNCMNGNNNNLYNRKSIDNNSLKKFIIILIKFGIIYLLKII
jgi:hypothetical protein